MRAFVRSFVRSFETVSREEKVKFFSFLSFSFPPSFFLCLDTRFTHFSLSFLEKNTHRRQNKK